MQAKKLEITTLGGGCFWCIEAVFQQIEGVEKIVSGYTGGIAPGKPTYREVCSGLTGHAEVVRITFDAGKISYHDILAIFMTSHDPTSLNKQGGDTGTQYRSVIYYHNKRQKEVSALFMQQMASYFDNPIVTEINPLGTFYNAEDHHQNYYANNTKEAYCTAVIKPKLAKLRNVHSTKLKKFQADDN